MPLIDFSVSRHLNDVVTLEVHASSVIQVVLINQEKESRWFNLPSDKTPLRIKVHLCCVQATSLRLPLHACKHIRSSKLRPPLL